MGLNILLILAVVSYLHRGDTSPHADESVFLRSGVETIPPHAPLAAPIRSSVESIPLQHVRYEDDERLPLRDAVEKRLISPLEHDSLYKYIEDVETDSSLADIGLLRQQYYGAASLYNSKKPDKRLQQGNANLEAMQQTATAPAGQKLVVCYMESWAAYRAPPLAFTAGLLPKSCTHLHYAFATLHPHTYAVIPTNEDYDVVKGGYRIATGLKRKYPGLKVIISVGGDGSDRLFSEMVQEHNRRRSFINSAVEFLREHEFDGLDLHWTYSGEKSEREREHLTSLLYELREKLSPYGLLLTTVLPPFRYLIEDGYDLNAVSGSTDYAILQAWDMTHGKRDEAPSRALQHSALHKDPGAASRDQRYENIEFMVKYIIRRGMAPEKLVLGIPLFGRSYTLAPSTLPAPGALVSGWGDEGWYTQTKGLLAYFEICMSESEAKGSSGIDEQGNSYAVFGNQWISYDTPSTVVDKMKFVLSSGLGGAAAWAIDMDDFRGLCGMPFPILNAISSQLNGSPSKSSQSSLKTGPCDSSFPYLASDEDSCAHFHFCSGGANYKITCEDNRLYDPSTGFCGHQDATKCMPGQSLRISVDEAARYLSQAYETDFEWNDSTDMKMTDTPERLVALESPAKTYKKNADNDKRVVCYMTSWAFYRRGDGKFVPEQIDTRLCTHIVYAYSSLSPDELIAKEFDTWADITNNLYERVTSLKDVKVLLGLGGWTDSSGDKYSRLVSSSSARDNFIKNVISFLRKHNFKGLHLDWQYPSCWQSNCKKGAKSDKPNFAKFVQELGKALHTADMELGVAVSGYKEVIESAYDLPTLSNAVDFLSAMTYDYHGGWEHATGHHTPIVPLNNDALAYYSIDYAIKALLKGGADPKKLNLGLAFYGQSYHLAEEMGAKGPGTPASGPGEAGEFTKQPGMLAYYEICYRVNNLGWKTGRQTNAGPYAYMGSQWVGYDDAKSITEKVEWALRQGLGGVTAWAIDLDDYNNKCCGEPSPLLRAAGRALGRSVPPPPSSACYRPPQPVTPAPPTTTTVASDGSHHGDHDHGSHHHHETTTWPSWSPASTSPITQQTWWPQSTTTSSTTTSTFSTTTSTTTTPKTTTTRRQTRPPSTTSKPSTDYGFEETCEAGKYKPAADDCGAYLQCVGGQWKKSSCAPGLHWHATENRCDWPGFAKCRETSESGSSTATTTLAPMTSRPPLSTTTVRPTTTTTRRTTTTQRTTTTTTRRTTTTEASMDSEDSVEGSSCTGQSFKAVSGDCNAYLHCDGYQWKLQRCAPGLHWSPKQNHCDWPKYAKCQGSSSKPTYTSTVRPAKPSRPTKPPTGIGSQTEAMKEDAVCSVGNSHAPASTCDSYLVCVSGRWKKQLCPPGLHWDKRSNRCDWAEFAMCEMKSSTVRAPAVTSKRPQKRPQTTTTKKPASDEYEITEPCSTGSYYAHPRCNKFYVCVNGVLVTQSCAPGLIWNKERAQCDFPYSASCTDRRTESFTHGTTDQTNMQLTLCNSGEYSMFPGDCTKYRHCLFGRFEEFSCSAGLHWNQEKQICDWPKSAKCKKKNVQSKPTTIKPMITKPEPQHDLTEKPSQGLEPSFDIPSSGTQSELLQSGYKLICYYTNWSWYRPGPGKYEPADIDPTLCTHIIYGFAVLGRDGLITAHDPWADYDNEFYQKVLMYKKYGIKVSLAIGGWNDSAGDKYSKLVNSPEARARFVTHVVQFLEKFGFDGLDLDWEYPKCWQVDCSKGPNSDKEGFAALVRELSAVFKPKGLLLSAAVSPNKKVIDAGYDVPVLAKHMDWIAVMTYDYHGQWDKKTGHVAPLFYHPDDDNKYFNADYSMRYWIKLGAPPSKLVMGMPMYGQTFTLGSQWDTSDEMKLRENPTGLNVPAASGGEAGEYTRAKGFLSYYEICDRINNRGWTVVRDPEERMGPYAYKDNQWVSFDDISIIKKKVKFLKSLKLAGGMVWALDLDDYRNRCGMGKHPLLNTIKNCLLKGKTNEDTSSNVPWIKPDNDDIYDIEVRPSRKPTTTTQRPTQAITDGSTSNDPIDTFKVVCYYTNWAWYRPDTGKYSPSDIDPTMCSHIIYAFAVLDDEKLIIKPHDSWLDVENKFYEKVVELKKHGAKVLLGLGGWKDSAGDKYSRLVNSPSARRKFVIHTQDFLEQFDFDGLDLDWEYPKCWQVECEKGPNSDKQDFASLVKELREAFQPRGWLLSAAVSASKRVIDAGYDVPSLSRNLDWISVMTYDYHGQWDKKTGHVAPMYVSEYDQEKTFNANFSINYWIQKGALPNKIVMGIPFYGQSFTLMENVGNGLGAPASAGGDAGDETRARGFLAFYEVCERIRMRGWRVIRDPGGRIGPYATLEDQWVSFDDDFMVRHKAEYVRAMGLGGGMVWALDLDDFTGKFCGCGKSPLLKTINHVLRQKDAPPSCPLHEIVATQGSTTEIDFTATSKPEKPAIEQETDGHEHTDIIDQGSDETHPEVLEPDTENNEPSLEGKKCNGIKFAADPNDCSKYYLCNNGEYTQLTCPSKLYWNKNHCDLPSRSNCKNRALLRLTSEESRPELPEDNKILACYFSNWAYYRPDKGSYGPDQVDTSLCTHIIYSWAHLDPHTFKIVPGIPELDIENDFYGKITELKREGVKIIIGVGGLEDSENKKWSRLVSSSKNIKTFIESLSQFLKRYNFDGVQMAWQYPVCKELPCSDVLKQVERLRYGELLSSLSKALRPDYELSAVVPSSAQVAVSAFDPDILSDALDWISVAANDYYASKSGKTTYLIELESNREGIDTSFNATLAFWANAVPLNKLVFTVPGYARSYTLRDTSSTGLQASVTSPGDPGPFTAVPGFLSYYEICTGLRSMSWKEIVDERGAYAVSGSQWASYLKPEQLHRIASSVSLGGARGAALWALDLDDGRGECGYANPLLRAIKQGLQDPTLPPTEC